MDLHSLPAEPAATALYLYGPYLKSNDEWTEYLEGW